mgnify:CR=1 FL=1
MITVEKIIGGYLVTMKDGKFFLATATEVIRWMQQHLHEQ